MAAENDISDILLRMADLGTVFSRDAHGDARHVVTSENFIGSRVFGDASRFHEFGSFHEEMTAATAEQLAAVRTALKDPDLVRAQMRYASARMDTDIAGGLPPDLEGALRSASNQADPQRTRLGGGGTIAGHVDDRANRLYRNVPRVEEITRQAAADTRGPWQAFTQDPHYQPLLAAAPSANAGTPGTEMIVGANSHAATYTAEKIPYLVGNAAMAESGYFESVRGRAPSGAENQAITQQLETDLRKQLEGLPGERQSQVLRNFEETGYLRSEMSSLIDTMAQQAAANGVTPDRQAMAQTLEAHIQHMHASGAGPEAIHQHLQELSAVPHEQLSQTMQARSGDIERGVREQLRSVAAQRGIDPHVADSIHISTRESGIAVLSGSGAVEATMPGMYLGHEMHLKLPPDAPADAAALLTGFGEAVSKRTGPGKWLTPEVGGFKLSAAKVEDFHSLVGVAPQASSSEVATGISEKVTKPALEAPVQPAASGANSQEPHTRVSDAAHPTAAKEVVTTTVEPHRAPAREPFLKGKGGLLGVGIGLSVAAYELAHAELAEAAVTVAGIVPGGATVMTAAQSGDVFKSGAGEVGGLAGAAALGYTGTLAGTAMGPLAPIAAPVLGLAGAAVGYMGGSAALGTIANLPEDADHSPAHLKLLSPEGQQAFNRTLDALDALPNNPKLPISPALQPLVNANKEANAAMAISEAVPKDPKLAAVAKTASETLVATYQAILEKPDVLAAIHAELAGKTIAPPAAPGAPAPAPSELDETVAAKAVAAVTFDRSGGNGRLEAQRMAKPLQGNVARA